MSTRGPLIVAVCSTCVHVRAARYDNQGDHGFDVSCSHPKVGARDVGDTRWETPEWCPLLADAAEQYLAAIRARLPLATAFDRAAVAITGQPAAELTARLNEQVQAHDRRPDGDIVQVELDVDKEER